MYICILYFKYHKPLEFTRCCCIDIMTWKKWVLRVLASLQELQRVATLTMSLCAVPKGPTLVVDMHHARGVDSGVEMCHDETIEVRQLSSSAKNCRPTMQEQRACTPLLALSHRQHRQSGWWLSRRFFVFLFCWSHEMQSVSNDWTSEFDQRGFLCQMEGRVRLTGEIPWNTGWGFHSSLLPFHQHSTPFISLTHLTGSGCFGGTFGLLRSSMVMPNQRHRKYHSETWLKFLERGVTGVGEERYRAAKVAGDGRCVDWLHEFVLPIWSACFAFQVVTFVFTEKASQVCFLKLLIQSRS